MIESSMIRIQNSFFNKLLFGKHPEDKKDPEFFEQGLNHGLISTNYYQVILCEMVKSPFPIKNEDELGLLIYHYLLEKTVPKLTYGLAFFRNKTNSSSILLQHKVEDLDEILEESAKDIKDKFNIDVTFGVGKPTDHPYDTNSSYFEALKALELETSDSVKHFKASGFMTLFNDENSEAINYFIKEHLKELAFSEDPFYVTLTETLKAYLDNQSEITTTADKLLLHRNTVSYRIKKCEEILDINLKDAQTSFNLRVALELQEILQ